jgi:hypothetical protein
LLLSRCFGLAIERVEGRRMESHPLVMFPAYFFTTLSITVHHQTVAPECPPPARSGSSPE